MFTCLSIFAHTVITFLCLTFQWNGTLPTHLYNCTGFEKLYWATVDVQQKRMWRSRRMVATCFDNDCFCLAHQTGCVCHLAQRICNLFFVILLLCFHPNKSKSALEECLANTQQPCCIWSLPQAGKGQSWETGTGKVVRYLFDTPGMLLCYLFSVPHMHQCWLLFSRQKKSHGQE